MRTFRLAVLNIVMPSPHSADRYLELFRETFRLRQVVKLRGDFVGMLGAVHDDRGVVSGYFYKFFNLDVKEGWFNMNRRQEAEPEDLSQIHVPDYLKPHHQSIRFLFFPKQHRLIFVTKDQRESLSPNMAKTLLDRLFADARLVQTFGEIEVTIEPNREQLWRIFSIPRLKVLTIEVSPPNPDDLDEAEREVMERMNGERAQKMIVELASKHPNGLQPDDGHKTLARIAQSNGEVRARGEDETGTVVTLSTADHSLIEPVTYDPNVQTRDAAMSEKAGALLQRLRD